MPTDRPIVIIAGMHRSGTTLLTRMLGETGLFAGRPEHLMPPAASNPEGHWELLAVARLNDAVLAAAGAHWAGPVEIDAGELVALADGPLGDRARGMRTAELAGVGIVKDPRFCLTLPFWRHVLDDHIVVVAPWRHPEEVSRSLHERNRFPDEHGRLLWDTYHRRLAAAAPGLPLQVVAHHDLLADPDATLAAAWHFIGEHTGRTPNRSVEPAIRPELVHHRVATDLDPDQRDIVAALRDRRPPAPLPDAERDRRTLVFGVAAALGIEHDRLRAIVTGQDHGATEVTE